MDQFAAVLAGIAGVYNIVSGLAALSAGMTVLVIFTYPLWAILCSPLQMALLFGLLGHADEFD